MDEFLDELRARLPVTAAPYALPARAGLIVVDVVNGFCTPGAGNLAPRRPDAAIEAMVATVATTARRFLGRGRPVFVFRDTHEPDRPEPPYPPHCVRGTGEERLAPALAFLDDEAGTTIVEKDVINPLVAAIGGGSDPLVGWIRRNRLEAVVIVGVCTDICDLDIAAALLSARNHYVDGRPMLAPLRDVVVYTHGCATYDLPKEAAEAVGAPRTAIHPQAETHHIGLYVMQARGAVIADRLDG